MPAALITLGTLVLLLGLGLFDPRLSIVAAGILMLAGGLDAAR